MGLAAVGSEILVNTTTASGQTAPVVAHLGDGSFVVAWRDESSGNGDIRAQRFAADGSKVGSEFRVNTDTNGIQYDPKILVAADGGFTIGWVDAEDDEVCAQRFDASGAPVGGEIIVSASDQAFGWNLAELADGRMVFTYGTIVGASDLLQVRGRILNSDGTFAGGEFLVNSNASEDGAQHPKVVPLAGGGFVVGWMDSDNVTDTWDIHARVYDEDGLPTIAELIVPASVAGVQQDHAIVALANGNFVVVWTDETASGDADGHGVRQQLFDATGVRIGGESVVNTTTAGNQGFSFGVPDPVTALAGGGYVVAWADGSTNQVKAQVFSSAGAKVGSEFALSTATGGGSQSTPQLHALPDGGFAAVWQDSTLDIRVQLFSASGAALGVERTVNTATTGSQNTASVAILEDGALVVVWADGSAGVGGATGDSSGSAIKGQVLVLTADPSLGGLGGTAGYTEGVGSTAKLAVAPALTVSDTDSAALSSATVSITGGFDAGEDALAFTNVPATMGNIAASYDATTGVLTLTSAGATATLAQWQAALRAVTYANSSDTPDTTDRTVRFVVNDGTSSSTAVTRTVTVAAANDTPVLGGGAGTTAFGGDTAVAVAPGLTVADADNATLASATVTITGNLQAGADVLAFVNNPATMGNIAATYDGTTGVLTLTSAGATATTAQWQAALRSVTYDNDSANLETGARTIAFATSDGGAISLAATQTVTLPQPAEPPAPPPAPVGSSGDDTVVLASSVGRYDAGDGDDLVYGSAANETVTGGAGSDSLMGGAGNDVIDGGSDVGYLRGGEGADMITGGDAFDDTHGNQGDDTVSGGGGDDWVVGGRDNDLLSGDAGGDVVFGNLGSDTCNGGDGADLIRGGQANDIIDGGADNDWISGDRGDDTLTGGLGADVFHTFGDAGIDRVTDFNAADGDKVCLLPGTSFAVAQVGSDTVITVEGSGQMILVGVTASALPDGWIFGA